MLTTQLAASLEASRGDFFRQAELRYNSVAQLLEKKFTALQDLQTKLSKYRSDNSAYMPTGTRSPGALVFEETILLHEVPGFDIDGKELSQAKRERLFQEAKAKSTGYRKAVEQVRTVEFGLDDMREQATQIAREIRGLELAIGFITASLEFFKK